MSEHRRDKTPHMPKFIALSGKKQVGKDTASAIIKTLCESQDRRVVVTAFAESLKRMCIEILGLNADRVYGSDEDKNKMSHIMWDGFPMEVRLKYSNQWTEFEDANDGLQSRMPLPRSGSMTNREVLQVMGTDVFRSIYGDVWAKAPFNRDWNDVDVVILTDCRFPNEKKVTQERGGVIIRLERPTGFVDNHPSEIALDGYLFENTFNNNGTIAELSNYLRNILIINGIING